MTGVDPKGLAEATEAVQAWLDWCDRNGEAPDARSGATVAIEAHLAALTPLKGAPLAWASATDEWFLALDCEDNVCCATQDHGEAIAALSRLHDYERGRIERLVPAPEAGVCSASQPLPETEEKRWPHEFLGRCAFCLDNAYLNGSCISMSNEDCLIRRARIAPQGEKP